MGDVHAHRLRVTSLIGDMNEGQRGLMRVSSARVPQRKPKLGQHFLTDSSAAARMLEALGDLSQGSVLEIGPGPGRTTDLLRARARRVVALELDAALAAAL